MGWAYYFVPETLETGTSLGLDGFRFYFLGRGGVLGDVDARWRVVRSATSSRRWWRTCGTQPKRSCLPGRRHVSIFPAAPSWAAGTSQSRRAGEFCAAAGAVNEAADPVGLALYSGFRSEPLVEDLPGRAMQLVSVLREFRGSAHLIAVRASGLDAKTAHFMRRPNDIGMFGWTAEEAPEIGDTERAQLAAADELTDRLVAPAYDAVDDAGRKAILAGLDQMEAAVSAFH